MDKGSKLYKKKVNIANVSTKIQQLENKEDIHINNHFLFLDKAFHAKNDIAKIDIEIHSLTDPVHSTILSEDHLP